MHAYLRHEQTELGDSVFQIKYPDIKYYEATRSNGHKVKKYDLLAAHGKFVPFITLIEKSLKSFNASMPSDRITAMTKMGIIDPSSMTNQEKLLNGYERDKNDPNAAGTKCATTN